jgi:hypothetical protein
MTRVRPYHVVLLVLLLLAAFVVGPPFAGAAQVDAPAIVSEVTASAPAAEVPVVEQATFLSALAQAAVSELLPIALSILSALGVLLAALASQFMRRLTQRIGNATFRESLQSLDELARMKVLEIYQDAIDDLKAAASDGRLTQTEIQAAYQTAVHELTETLPDFMLEAFKRALRGGIEQVQEQILGPAIERAVQTSAITSARVNTEFDTDKLQERLQAARARIGLTY